MTTLREAAQQALEALENASDIMDSWAQKRQDDAIAALRAALAEPVQEPVAWESSEDGKTIQDNDFTHDVVLRVTGDFENDRQRISYAKRIVNNLNAAPPQRKPLTDEEIADMWVGILYDSPPSGVHEDGLVPHRLARAVERAHGIGEAA